MKFIKLKLLKHINKLKVSWKLLKIVVHLCVIRRIQMMNFKTTSGIFWVKLMEV